MTRAFSSKAQKQKWKEMVDQGRVTQAQFDQRETLTGNTALPDRAAPRVRTVGPSRSADASKINDTRY